MSDMMERIDLRRDFVAEKFSTVDITESGCWNWTGKVKKSRGGYGQILLYCNQLENKKRLFAAHRVSYAYYNGVDPGGLCVMHICDNPTCVNPDHLKLGTHADNMRDMADKGRSTRGETNPRSKLTTADVGAIVELIQQGHSNTEIASKLPVSHAQVSLIRHGKSWGEYTKSLGYKPDEHRVFSRKAA